MTKQPHDEEAIFQIAREIKDPAKRAAYLNQACGDDQLLRQRVEALLKSHESGTEFLKSNERVATTAAATIQQNADTKQIGPYKIREQIGEGGMGIVYVAEQQTPVRRKVALKVIKPGMDSKEVVARFEAERQALAMMDHPGIAKVFDGGVTESGQPYFAMELINGIPITQYCDEQKLGIRERLELFVSVCHAVQHAHQKGVIHRDIKPTNVLVTIHDGRPVPVVIDFGVAKATNQNLTEQTIYTRLHQVVGTTLYMSPEQAELSRFGVDTRTDIYSLGVLLYEMLAGTTPFDRERFKQAALDEVRRIIREEEPPKPSTRLSSLGDTATKVSSLRRTDPQKLRHSLRGDLDWIVMMSLEKDRNRRYETANGLAMDVTRFLNDEPVLARPPSTWYRLQKFYRRNKALTTTSLVIVLALTSGLAAAVWGLGVATEAANDAKLAELQAKLDRDEKVEMAGQLEAQLYLESLRSARNLYYENNLDEVEQILRNYRNAPLVKSGEDFNWYSLWKECDRKELSTKFELDQAANRVDGHPTRDLIVVSDWDGNVYLLELHPEGLKELWKEPIHNSFVLGRATRPAFVDDGNYIFFPVFADSPKSNSPDAKRVFFRFVSVLDPSVSFNLPTQLILPHISDRVTCCASLHNRIAFAMSDGSISIWEFDPGVRQIKAIDQIPPRRGRIQDHHGGIAFCPSNPDLLAVSYVNEGIYINQVRDRNGDFKVFSFEDGPGNNNNDIEWSPDGSKIVVGFSDTNTRIIDIESRKPMASLMGFHNDEVYSVAWSPDSSLIATGGRDGTVRIFDAVTFHLIDTLRFYSGMIYSLDFIADQSGEMWLFAGTKSYGLWATPVRSIQTSVLRLDGRVHHLGLSSDGETLAAICDANEQNSSGGRIALRFFDSSNGEEQDHVLSDTIFRAASFSDGSLAACVSASGDIQVIDLDKIKVIGRASGVSVGAYTDLDGKSDSAFALSSLICFSPDESLLAVTNAAEHQIRFFSVPDLREAFPPVQIDAPIRRCSISCDNSKIAFGRDDGTVSVIDLKTGKKIVEQKLHRDAIFSLRFSPTEENMLASGGWDNRVVFWDITGDPIGNDSHLATIRDLSFSRDGMILYSCGGEGNVKAWRMPDGRPMSSFRLYEDRRTAIYDVAFSRNRSVLAITHRNYGIIHMIRAATLDDVRSSSWWKSQ